MRIPRRAPRPPRPRRPRVRLVLAPPAPGWRRAAGAPGTSGASATPRRWRQPPPSRSTDSYVNSRSSDPNVPEGTDMPSNPLHCRSRSCRRKSLRQHSTVPEQQHQEQHHPHLFAASRVCPSTSTKSSRTQMFASFGRKHTEEFSGVSVSKL